MKGKRGREGEDIKAEEAQADVTARIPVIVEAATVSRQKEKGEGRSHHQKDATITLLQWFPSFTITVILMPKAHLCSF